jgi:hypothetical protein
VRASYRPWYREERCQGSLVSLDGGRSGIFLGTAVVRRPASPETLYEVRLEVLVDGAVLQLDPWRVISVHEPEQKDQ